MQPIIWPFGVNNYGMAGSRQQGSSLELTIGLGSVPDHDYQTLYLCVSIRTRILSTRVLGYLASQHEGAREISQRIPAAPHCNGEGRRKMCL